MDFPQAPSASEPRHDGGRAQPGPGRKIAAVATATVLAGAVVTAFWYQDWRYSLPTPQPPDWHPSAIGSPVHWPATVPAAALSHPSRPLFLHFFNPDCPCSRFNLEHVRSL